MIRPDAVRLRCWVELADSALADLHAGDRRETD
jgi:hypothetical protein